MLKYLKFINKHLVLIVIGKSQLNIEKGTGHSKGGIFKLIKTHIHTRIYYIKNNNNCDNECHINLFKFSFIHSCSFHKRLTIFL